MPRRIAAALLLLGPLARGADAPAPPDLAELRGPLVLAGAGPLPDDARDAVFDLAGKEKAKIVVVAGAADEAVLKAWREKKPAAVVLLHARDRKAADDPAVAKLLADATAVWVAGGDPEVMRDTVVEKEVRKLHARGGVVGGATGDPFGFLTGFVVAPNDAAKRLRIAVANRRGSVGLGIGPGSAVVARGRTLRVVGDGTVAIHVAAGGGRDAATQTATAGDLFDTFQLRRAALNRAAKEPFPPKSPAAPVVEKGSLVIVGGGGAGPEIWKTFIELAGGPDAPIVMIPTALEDPLPAVPGEVAALKRFGAKSVEVLHTRSRAEANDPKFSAALLKAKGVWFGGGRQWRFVDAYEGTLVETRIRAVLAGGGVIGGSSAGASIQGEFMPRGHPLGNTVMAAEGYERGFGYLPGCAVDQHFFARNRTADMTGLMKLYPQYLGIGIDEGTAIVVTGRTAAVIGKTKVAFYDATAKPAGDTDYVEVKAGERYDLKKRAKVE